MNNRLIIESKNLRLCPFEESDFDLFLRIYSDKRLMRYVNTALNWQQTELFFNKTLHQYDSKTPHYYIGQITNKQTKKIGLAGIFWNHKTKTCAEVGAMLLPNNIQKGYGSEIFRAIMKELFLNKNIEEVVYYHHPKNVGAYRICQSLGCQNKGEHIQKGKKVTQWHILLSNL